jgi:nucleoid DNA-binding protein
MNKAKKTTKTHKSAEKKTVKTAAKLKVAKVSAKETMSKSQIVACIAENTGVAKKQVSHMMECLSEIIFSHLKKGAAGVFNLPGLLKLYVVRKPATKARKGINPFTKEEVMFKAKPARNVVKARVLKKLKDVAA